jgi:hypothetical protein
VAPEFAASMRLLVRGVAGAGCCLEDVQPEEYESTAAGGAEADAESFGEGSAGGPSSSSSSSSISSGDGAASAKAARAKQVQQLTDLFDLYDAEEPTAGGK